MGLYQEKSVDVPEADLSRTSEIFRVDGTHVVTEVPEITYADPIDLLVEGQKTYTVCSSLGSHNQRFGLDCC